MTLPPSFADAPIAGVHLRAPHAQVAEMRAQWLQRLAPHLTDADFIAERIDADTSALRVSGAWLAAHAPAFDTLQLCAHFGLKPQARADDAFAEVALALLCSPVPMPYPSAAELDSAIRIRIHVAEAARRTALAFKTEAAERPADCWHYDDEHGFLLNEGVDLIAALEKATQPGVSGKLYDFSCYRASEYVILLGLARELQRVNPPLYDALQAHCRRHAIRSGAFHEVFVIEYGHNDAPLPPLYHVPGDRLWFRNPDEFSANATGYEGSWVIYMGEGLFSNFWKINAPFTMQAKCLEIHHWRDGAFTDAQGEVQMDESVVEARVADTLQDPNAVARILTRMMRWRDLQGRYADGGCIDRTREYPRWVRADSPPFALPALAPASP